MTDDYLRDLFGANDFTPPPSAPCLPTPGATAAQIRTHADRWYEVGTTQQARKLCAGCPAKTACLAANLDDQWGVFGGTTAEERKRLRDGAAA